MKLEEQKFEIIQWIAELEDEAIVKKLYDFMRKESPELVFNVRKESDYTELLTAIREAKNYSMVEKALLST